MGLHRIHVRPRLVLATSAALIITLFRSGSAQEQWPPHPTKRIFQMGFSRPLISIDGKPLRDHAGAMPMRPGGIMVYWIDCNAKAAVISFDQAGMDGQNIKGSWPVVSTAMFCPDYEEGPSHGVGDAVAAVESWRLDDLGMLVLEGGGHTLVFGPEPGRPLPIGRAWLAAARQP